MLIKKFEIHFSSNFEVYKLVYTNRVAIRGKDSSAYQTAYSFQWTQAVKALSILILRSLIYKKYVLEGDLASSLDYSIAKNTHWLSDLFGVDVSGRALAKKVFKRFNSERSIKVPVGISINRNYFEKIEVYLDNELQSIDKIKKLLENLEFNLGIDSEQNFKSFDLKNYLIGIYQREFFQSIYRTDIFSENSMSKNVRSVKNAGLFKKISGKDFKIEDTKLSNQAKLGLDFDVVQAKSALDGIKVYSATALVGAVVLFSRLKRTYNLKLNFNYPHAVRMINDLISGKVNEVPDLICSGIAPAATFLANKKSKDYSILMFLPDISQQVVAHKSATFKNKSTRRYTYLKEDPSIPSFMLEELLKMKVISKNKVKLQHDEPDDSFNLMQTADPELRAALFFPHYNFNCDFNNCLALPDPREKSSCQEVVLLVHKSKLKNKLFIQTIEAVLRDAWLEMRTSPSLVKNEVSSLFNDETDYYKRVVRYGGLHHKLINALY